MAVWNFYAKNTTEGIRKGYRIKAIDKMEAIKKGSEKFIKETGTHMTTWECKLIKAE